MVKGLHRPKAPARSKTAGHVEPVMERYHAKHDAREDEKNIEALGNTADTGIERDTSSLKDKLLSLVRDEVGNTVHVRGFRLDVETDDVEISVTWRNPYSISRT